MEASAPGSPLSIERHKLGDGSTQLALVGELDLATLHVLEQELDRIAPTEKQVGPYGHDRRRAARDLPDERARDRAAGACPGRACEGDRGRLGARGGVRQAR